MSKEKQGSEVRLRGYLVDELGYTDRQTSEIMGPDRGKTNPDGKRARRSLANELYVDRLRGDIKKEKQAKEMAEVRAEKAEVRAETDSLTGLYNRLSFLELGEKQLALSRRHGKESWLMFLDLNGLKEVNDKFGHENGDILLKESAYRLKHTLRISDLTARLGGDEFGVLMAGVDLEGAKKVANKIGEQLLSIEINGSQEFSGVAIGLARCNDVGSFEDFIKDADLLMYKAKNKESGASQNRVAFVDSNGGVGFVNLEQQVSQ